MGFSENRKNLYCNTMRRISHYANLLTMKHLKHILLVAVMLTTLLQPVLPLNLQGKVSAESLGNKVKINEDQAYTRDSLVTVRIFIAVPEINQQVRLATCLNIEGCRMLHSEHPQWGQWQDIQSLNYQQQGAGVLLKQQLMLQDPRGSGERWVCYQSKKSGLIDRFTPESNCDRIVLDNLPPLGGAVINDGASETSSLNLWALIKGQDQVLADGSSGVGGIEYSVSETRVDWQPWASLNSDSKYVFGKYPIDLTQPTTITGYVKFRDKLGNESPVFSDTILYSPTRTVDLPIYGVRYADSLTNSGEFTLSTIPNYAVSGGILPIALSVRNVGSLLWRTTENARRTGEKTVRLAYTWYKVDENTGQRVLHQGDNNRGELGRDLDYTWSDDYLQVKVVVPQLSGNYILQFDAVYEDVAAEDTPIYFSQFGNATPEYNVKVGEQAAVVEGLTDWAKARNIPVQDSIVITAASLNYVVQPPRSDPSWRCLGVDCYSGIAEEFYQCSARGIPNYVINTTDGSRMTSMCWWPIYAANLHLYSGLLLPPYFVDHPWEYVQVGWILTIPDNPWMGGVPPYVPPVIPPGNFVPGEGGGTPADPYAGLNGAYSAWPQVTFDRFIAWDGSYKLDQLKWSETQRPVTPIITGLNTNVEGNKVTVYGVGIPKHHPMNVRVWNEFRYCWACGSGWEFFYQQGTAQHVKIVLFKSDWNYLGEVWNDSPDGRWRIDLPLGMVLNPGDYIMAEVQVEADFTFPGLHWWADTFETVNFNLRDPKYTGYPYFGSGTGQWSQIPQKPNLSPAQLAFIAREGVASYSPASDLHEYCGAWIRDYHYFMDGGDTWPTYSNLIYNPAYNQVFRLRGDIRLAYWNKYAGTCGVLGLPTTDDLWAAPSPLGTTGAYQQFANGTIHSSYLGTFSTTGKLNQIHTSGGGTAKYGFPTGEMYLKDGDSCQDFETATICETKTTDKPITQLFVDRVTYHFNNNIPCLFGGETAEGGVDCRGLALLAIREVTGKNAGEDNCDRFGTCDPKKHIPSTGSDGLAKNYYPYAVALRAQFPYTAEVSKKESVLTLYDWHSDGIVDHTNVVIGFTEKGNRIWVYSNAECELGKGHLQKINEDDLIRVKEIIVRGGVLAAEDEYLLRKIHLTDLTEEERLEMVEYIEADGRNKDMIDFIIKTRSANYAWTQEISN